MRFGAPRFLSGPASASMKWHADRSDAPLPVTLRLTAVDCLSPLRSILALARANVIGNALCYGKEALLRVRQKDGSVEAMVIDKGPGIRALGRDGVSIIAHPQDGGHGLGFTIALTPIQTRRVQLARDAVHAICTIGAAAT